LSAFYFTRFFDEKIFQLKMIGFNWVTFTVEVLCQDKFYNKQRNITESYFIFPLYLSSNFLQNDFVIFPKNSS